MKELFWRNIRYRLSDWLRKPEYVYIDYILDRLGKL